MASNQFNVALLVHSCDRYEFLYHGFDIFFSKHWDFDIACNYYFATEEKDALVNKFQTVQSGKGEWSDRLAFLLKNKISEKYVLYFQEDMWLNKKVNKNFFNNLFQLAQQNSWKQVKLHSSEVYKTTPTQWDIEGFNIALVDNAASEFLMSHQVTLWDKEFLLNQLLKSEHPWRNERRGTKRLKKLNPQILQADYFAENGKPAINQNNNPIERSEYHTISINGMLGNNVEAYISTLMEGDENQQQYGNQLLYHYKNNLTHDGKPKPRKEDPFKKLKNFLQGK
jgi:hypothetical protein